MMNSAHPHFEQLVQLVTAPHIKDGNLSFCQQCQDELYIFVSDELAGQDVDMVYPEIAHHLNLCEWCLQEYVELADLTTNALYSEVSP
ncbi:MAG: hypothetical protein HN929_10325 [Chloroflexi bacterium]|jgi:hypothetical protein|nr:hypothetical protein [Chloroflexota bacterium]MBT7081845.1 hypothetical protein [Chloroflexota bacterium]